MHGERTYASPETYSSEQIAQTLHTAHTHLQQMTATEPFINALRQQTNERGRQLITEDDDYVSPRYWQTAAAFSRGILHESPDSGVDALQAKALHLVASAPSAFIEAAALNNVIPPTNLDRWHSRYTVSYFNGLIRDFAIEYPQTKPSDVMRTLHNVTVRNIESPAVRNNARTDSIPSLIVGAQHELGFGQLLQESGETYRTGLAQDDLNGIDFLVSHRGINIPIDVKASLHKVHAVRGADQTKAYAINPFGVAVTYSLLQKQDFHDSFFPDIVATHSRAPSIPPMLDEIAQQLDR